MTTQSSTSLQRVRQDLEASSAFLAAALERDNLRPLGKANRLTTTSDGLRFDDGEVCKR